MSILVSGIWEKLASDVANPLRIYMYSRVDGKSLFGFCEAYKETELEDQASYLSFELMDVKYEKFADVRENRSEGISVHALEGMIRAAQEKKYNVLMLLNCDRVSIDPQRCFEIIDKMDMLGISIFSLHEGWINVSETEGAETKLEQMRSRIRTAEEEDLNKLFDRIIEENIGAFEELAK